MHAALKSFDVRAAACMAIVLAVLLAPGKSDADGASPAPTPSASPSAVPSPSPTPRLKTQLITENYLGKVIAHAGPREGYTLPIIELQRLGARTIGDALRFVPGVLVRQTGTAGALQTVALRGNSASQTLILLDGRPVNEGDTGVTDFTSMPLDGIQNIVVIEGGLSSRYGSGAIGGVVEIYTRHPGSSPHESVYAQLGYQGDFASGAAVSTGGMNGGVALDAFTRYANNTFDYPSFAGITGGTRTNNDLHASDITFCACFHFSGNGDSFAADLHLDDNTSEVGAPGSTQFGPSFVSVFARQQRDVQRNSLNLSYATTHALTTAVLYVDGRRLHFYDTTPSFPYDTLTLATQRGFSVTQAVQLRSTTLTAKYEQNGTTALFQGTIDTPMQLIARDSTTDLYVGDQYQASDRGPRIDAAVQFAHTQGSPSTTLPSVAASQQIGGAQGSYGTLVRSSYARAFRAPNLDERYFPGFGNPKLLPEYASTFDAGVLTDNRVVDASATFFGSDTDNLIVNQAIDMLGDFLPFNIGRARVPGFSVLVSNAYHPRVGIQASYTGYPVAKDLSTAPDINGVVTTGNRLLYRPTATATLELWRRAGYDPREEPVGEDGFDLLFVGRQYADEENLHVLPPYATVGLHISRNLSPHLNLLLRVDNLTDQRVPQVYGYPVLGTTFSVRLTAK